MMGEANAMDSLATLLDETDHPEEAIYWYKRAVEAGNSTSAWNLAMHYIPLKQKRLYRYWMRKAAAMGEEDAVAEVKKFAADPHYVTKLPLKD